jgi:hypothetical protein
VRSTPRSLVGNGHGVSCMARYARDGIILPSSTSATSSESLCRQKAQGDFPTASREGEKTSTRKDQPRQSGAHDWTWNRCYWSK